MRVLLIDNRDATEAISLRLMAEGFTVTAADTGEGGIELAKLYDYEIILMDLNLPDISGFDVIKRLRAAKITVPIMILSGVTSIEDKVLALNLGASDYLIRPFHRDELVARIKAIVRRWHGHFESAIQIGDLTVDIDSQSAKVLKNYLRLTPKEYLMLELLALRKGKLVTKDKLFDYLYGGFDTPEFKIIDVFIFKIRRKLAIASNGESFIETVWGRGFLLREGFYNENHYYSPTKINRKRVLVPAGAELTVTAVGGKS